MTDKVYVIQAYAVNIYKCRLLSGVSSAGLTPSFPILLPPYQAVPATSSHYIIIMVRLHTTSLLAVTLATGSVLASSNEYQR